MTDWLGGDLATPVMWQATDTPPPDSELTRLAAGQWDINKFAHYLPIYEKVLQPFRDTPVRMLEIGTNLGGSLELWRKYFTHPDAVIVGIDNNPRCAQLDDPANNVYVRIGQQQDHAFLAEVVDELGPFDIILDDGSHIPSFTLQSFQYLFPRLNDGGSYIVEDLFSCYTPDGREPFPIPGANDGSPTFIEFVKQLIDVMHATYLHTPSGDQIADAFEPGNRKRRPSFQVPLATTIISAIELHDSIVVIRKGQREVPRIIRRWSAQRLRDIVAWNPEKLFRKYPHLGEADRIRRDWLGVWWPDRSSS